MTADIGISAMVSPAAIDVRVGVRDTFVLKAQTFNEPQGRQVTWHNEGFHAMDRILLEEELKTPLNTLLSIALMLIFLAELISEAAALIRSPKKILKTEGSNDLIGILLQKHPISQQLSFQHLMIFSGKGSFLICKGIELIHSLRLPEFKNFFILLIKAQDQIGSFLVKLS
jgi:hypothetical protein